jgi:hypothetical protein
MLVIRQTANGGSGSIAINAASEVRRRSTAINRKRTKRPTIIARYRAGPYAESRVRHIFGNATFSLAVYALPFFAAIAGGLFAYHTGAGPIGGAAIAMAAGAATLVAGQFAFAHSRSTILRTMIAVAFALPAAVAGYHLALGLSAMGMPSDTWRHVFAIIGAVVVGSTAWARLVAQPSGELAGCAADPASPQA